MLNSGERFRKQRKVLHQGMNADHQHYTELKEDVCTACSYPCVRRAHISILTGNETFASQSSERTRGIHGTLREVRVYRKIHSTC